MTRIIPSAALLVVLIGHTHCSGQPFVPGQSYFSSDGAYIEYIAGNSAVILTAPHGGTLSPATIPDRDCSDPQYTQCETGTDLNTDDLAATFVQTFHSLTNLYPHVVIAHIDRAKVDLNRDIIEAAHGNVEAELAWTEWHGFIDAAKDTVVTHYRHGLYLDLHGHGHPNAWLELGYLLSTQDLLQDDAALAAGVNDSSIRQLSGTSPLSFADLLRGPTDSFGALMQNLGYDCVPGPKFPDPGVEKFLSGGYNTRRHGSWGGGTISGLQIEAHSGFRNSVANREAAAEAMTVACVQYLTAHFGIYTTGWLGACATASTSLDCNGNGLTDACETDLRVPDQADLLFDFESPSGWTVGAPGDTATAGTWVRVDPVGTAAQPEYDRSRFGTSCWVTGQGAIGGANSVADVDGGATTLTSSAIDVSGLTDPYLGYWRWLSNDEGLNPQEDPLEIFVTADGTTWIRVETVGPNGIAASGGWFYHQFRVRDFVAPTATLRLRFIVADAGAGGSIVEAAIDDVFLFDAAAQSPLAIDDNHNATPDACEVLYDFEAASGWISGDPSDTATTGAWVRVDPHGTTAQPEYDRSPAGTTCWVTGQGAPGGASGASDVDAGSTTLTSPAIDVTAFADARIGYWRWFSNDTSLNPGDDVLRVEISADGSVWSVVEIVGPTGVGSRGGWFYHQFRVADFVTPTPQLRIRFIASDGGAGGSVVEAALDDVVVLDGCDPDGCGVARFVRADCNADGLFNIADAVATLAALFGSATPSCLAACDANNDGAANIADAVFSLSALFSAGTAPAAPFPACAPAQLGPLACASFSACP